MDLSQDFISVLNAVTNKRARFVIDTILEKGYCSTEDLKNGGYEHAPRAARDVRELGIPLETYKIKDSTGKSIAAYRFGDWEEAKRKNQLSKTSGRTQLTEKLKMHYWNIMVLSVIYMVKNILQGYFNQIIAFHMKQVEIQRI